VEWEYWECFDKGFDVLKHSSGNTASTTQLLIMNIMNIKSIATLNNQILENNIITQK
jgi:hypothetical protein